MTLAVTHKPEEYHYGEPPQQTNWQRSYQYQIMVPRNITVRNLQMIEPSGTPAHCGWDDFRRQC